MAEVLAFRKPDVEYLQQAIRYLQQLLQTDPKEATYQDVQRKLGMLNQRYWKALPHYFSDITFTVEMIVKEVDPKEYQLERVEQTLEFCLLLQEPVTTSLVRKMIQKDFFGVYDYDKITEEILLDFIQELQEEQEDAEDLEEPGQSLSLDSWKSDEVTEMKLEDFIQNVTRNRGEFWYGIVNMVNATERVLIKTIEVAELDCSMFYELCESVLGNSQISEAVLMALVKRLQELQYVETKRLYRRFKQRLYYFVLQSPAMTRAVANQILNDGCFMRGELYESFYERMIKGYGKFPEIQQQVLAILTSDEKTLGQCYQAKIRKLQFMAQNCKIVS